MNRGAGAAGIVLAVAVALAVGGAFPVISAASASTRGLTPRIINGQEANPGQFPFTVALLDPAKLDEEGAYQSQFCGGTLTTPTTVVTAAHCVVDGETGHLTVPAEVVIGIGRSLKSPDLRTVPVAAVTAHPGYNRETEANDIAVVTLTQPITDIAPLPPLLPIDPSAYTEVGASVQVAGWGNTSTKDDVFPDVLRFGALEIFPDATCGRGQVHTIRGVKFEGYDRSEANAKFMLCAAGITNTGKIVDSCQGDSGGPLFGGEGASARLIGVVSWGDDCATQRPGVYTRVSAMSEFLLSQGAIQTLAPTLAPAISVESMSSSLRVSFAITPDGSAINSMGAVATDQLTGATQACTSGPRADGIAPFCTIANLANGSQYSVSGVASNSAGASPAATAVLATPIAVPIPGRIKGTSQTGAGRVRFLVTSSDGNGSELAPVRLACLPVRGGAGRSARVVDGRAVVTGLRSIRYSCAIVTRNALGSARSDPIGVRSTS